MMESVEVSLSGLRKRLACEIGKGVRDILMFKNEYNYN